MAAAVVAIAKAGVAPEVFGSVTEGPFSRTSPQAGMVVPLLGDPTALIDAYRIPVVG